MYEAYTGIGENKDVRFTEEKFSDARQRAWVMAACGLHCGLLVDGKIVYHTNKDDPEWIAVQQAKDFQPQG